MGFQTYLRLSEVQEDQVLEKVVGGEWKIPFTYLQEGSRHLPTPVSLRIGGR